MLISRSIPDCVFTCEEAGEAVANADDEQQREFLIAMCNAADVMDRNGGCWAMQCRAIVDGSRGKGSGLSDSDRFRIASMLNCLVDHLVEAKS